jgi:hypothetical protein
MNRLPVRSESSRPAILPAIRVSPEPYVENIRHNCRPAGNVCPAWSEASCVQERRAGPGPVARALDFSRRIIDIDVPPSTDQALSRSVDLGPLPDRSTGNAGSGSRAPIVRRHVAAMARDREGSRA